MVEMSVQELRNRYVRLEQKQGNDPLTAAKDFYDTVESRLAERNPDGSSADFAMVALGRLSVWARLDDAPYRLDQGVSGLTCRERALLAILLQDSLRCLSAPENITERSKS